MKKEKTAIGIDLGGTNIKGVLMRESGEILDCVSRDTYIKEADRVDVQHWKKEIVGIIQQFQSGNRTIQGIGMAAPGLTNHSNQSIAHMPGRLQGLENLEWNRLLDHPGVRVLNDAHAALIAESRVGIGKGIRNQLMVTLGTGVGGAILVDGKLYQGFLQRAGHLGHMSLNSEGQPGILNIPGSLEEAFGNASVSKRTFGKFATVHSLVDGYKAGDTIAGFFWLGAVNKLALALCSLINIVSPELIILGGGITKAKEALTKPLDHFMTLYEWRPGGISCPVRLSEFNEFSGAVGAALFSLNHEEHVCIE